MGCARRMIALCVTVAVAGPAAAGELTLRLSEPLKRAWEPAVVHLEARLPNVDFQPETFVLVDEAGQAVPFQVSDIFQQVERRDTAFRVWVRTGLEPWQTRSWKLRYGGTKAVVPKTDLTVERREGAWVVSNAKTAVRVTAVQQEYRPAAEPGAVPAPLQAVRGRSGRWIGRGWLTGPQRVTACRSDLTAGGPIFAEVKATYDFEGGRYTMWVRLDCQDDVIQVREEFDLGEPSPARDQHFCFSLYEGLRPDTLRWRGRYWDKTLAVNAPQAGYGLYQEAVAPLTYDRDRALVRLLGLFCWWPESAHCWAVYAKDQPDGDLVGVVRARAGFWRNPTCVFLDQWKKPDLVMRCPLRQPVQDWGVEGVDYGSPYYTGVVARGTPRSYGRRQWGILVSTPREVVPANDDMTRSGLTRALIRYGDNPLDKVKDWVLDWPDPGPTAYPRGWIRRDQLPALKARVEKDPELQKRLKSPQHKPFRYLVTGEPTLGRELIHATAGGDANWMGILPMLRWSVDKYLREEGDLGYHTFMHHGIGLSGRAAPLFDVAMSVPEMTPSERREARALFAFLQYKLSDPDWLAKEAGFHLGNPNMPTAAENQIGVNAALLAGHPLAIPWAMRAVANCQEMFTEYVAPGGAWRECPHYQHDAAMRFIIGLADPLANAGFIDLYQQPGFKATMLYAAQILTPVDPRFGIRTVPSLGNSSHETTSNFGRMAVGTARSDPKFSAWMQWAHRAVGAPYMYPFDEMVLDPSLPAERPDLSSRVFPGFGAILRAHVDTPQEVYVSFRIGRWVEHYENDQGSIVFHAKGAPLCDDFGSLYQPTMLRPWMHNRIAFDHKLDWDSTGEITAHAFLEAADAVTGTLPVTRLWPYPEEPGTPTPPNQAFAPGETIPLVTWTRQMVLVKDTDPKGANYLVLRDSFGGQPTKTTEWTLWCLAETVETRPGLARFKGQLGVDLDVSVIVPADQAMSTGQYGHKGLFYNGGFWQKQNPNKPWEEVQRYIRLKRDPGLGYLAVLYPRLPAEGLVSFAAWGGGAGVVGRIGPTEHVVVLAADAGRWAAGDIELEGRQAVVRRSAGDVNLALLEGTRLRCGEVVIEGASPVGVHLVGDKLKVESNLAEPAAVRLRLPGAVRVDGAERKNGVWHLALPGGRYRR